jgi:cysteine-rich repeat protein
MRAVGAPLLFLSLGLAHAALGGVNGWTSRGPVGGRLLVVAIDPVAGDRVYAGGPDSVLLRSVDGGESWVAGSLGEVLRIAIDPRAPSTVFASTYDGLYRSTSYGTAWTRVLSGTAYEFLLDPFTSGTVWAHFFSNEPFAFPMLVRSTDGGATWTESPDPVAGQLSTLAADPHHAGTLYASHSAGSIWKSTDGGTSWSQVGHPALFFGTEHLVVDPVDPDTLFLSPRIQDGVRRSTDGGRTWTTLGERVLHYPGRVTVARTTPKTLYVPADGRLWRSRDGGSSWEPADGGVGVARVSGVAVDESRPARLVAVTQGEGAFRSADGGDTWSPSSAGMFVTRLSALAVAPTVPATIYAAGDVAGGYVSRDGGATWVHVAPRGPGDYDGPPFIAFAVDPTTPTIVHAATRYQGIWRTRDSGLSWELETEDAVVDAPFVDSLVVEPTTARLYAGGGRGIRRSTDGGASWQWATQTFPTTTLSALAVVPGRPDVLYASQGGYVFKSVDGGASWTDLGIAALRVWSALVADGGTVYAGGPGGIVRSTDDGASWRAIATTAAVALALDPGRPGQLLAATGDAVVEVAVDGAGERILPRGDLSSFVWTVAVDPHLPDVLYAATGADGVMASERRCGNGRLDPGEACDDGNLRDGDGCSVTCEVRLASTTTSTATSTTIVVTTTSTGPPATGTTTTTMPPRAQLTALDPLVVGRMPVRALVTLHDPAGDRGVRCRAVGLLEDAPARMTAVRRCRFDRHGRARVRLQLTRLARFLLRTAPERVLRLRIVVELTGGASPPATLEAAVTVSGRRR